MLFSNTIFNINLTKFGQWDVKGKSIFPFNFRMESVIFPNFKGGECNYCLFVFLICVLVLCFLIFHHKDFSLSLSFIVLVEFWFELILTFFLLLIKRNLSLYQNTFFIVMNLNMPTNCLNNKLLQSLPFIPLISFYAG